MPKDANLFSRGREIIAAAVPALGLNPGDVILVPASLCWEALSPLLAHGLVVRCYPLDERLRLDCTAVRELADEKTRAIYIVHYFGFSQDIAPLRAWCDAAGVRMIEDCALCFFEGGDNGGLGGAGDLSLFSLWKFLPVPDGAIARVRDGIALPAPKAPSRTQTWLRAGRLAAGAAIASVAPLRFLLWRRQLSAETAPYEPPGDAVLPLPHAMSAISRKIWKRIDPAAVANARRANYRALVGALHQCPEARPLWPELPSGVVPFALPVRVRDPVGLSRALVARGVGTEISINRFFRGHPRIIGHADAFRAVDDLADHVLSLPVHQGMSKRDAMWVARLVRDALA